MVLFTPSDMQSRTIIYHICNIAFPTLGSFTRAGSIERGSVWTMGGGTWVNFEFAIPGFFFFFFFFFFIFGGVFFVFFFFGFSCFFFFFFFLLFVSLDLWGYIHQDHEIQLRGPWNLFRAFNLWIGQSRQSAVSRYVWRDLEWISRSFPLR